MIQLSTMTNVGFINNLSKDIVFMNCCRYYIIYTSFFSKQPFNSFSYPLVRGDPLLLGSTYTDLTMYPKVAYINFKFKSSFVHINVNENKWETQNSKDYSHSTCNSEQ